MVSRPRSRMRRSRSSLPRLMTNGSRPPSASTQRRDVLIAEAGASRLNIIVRSAMGFSVAIVLAKLFVWDKVIGSLVGCSQAPVGTCGIFVTDPLDDNQWHVIMVVIGFYFLYEGGTALTRVVARRL